MNYIRESVKMENIKNTVRCYVIDNPLTLDAIQESISNQELRRKMVKTGEEDALMFLSNIQII
jgi:hypothetical protein